MGDQVSVLVGSSLRILTYSQGGDYVVWESPLPQDHGYGHGEQTLPGLASWACLPYECRPALQVRASRPESAWAESLLPIFPGGLCSLALHKQYLSHVQGDSDVEGLLRDVQQVSGAFFSARAMSLPLIPQV
jgi:hypothetical protein